MGSTLNVRVTGCNASVIYALNYSINTIPDLFPTVLIFVQSLSLLSVSSEKAEVNVMLVEIKSFFSTNTDNRMTKE